MDDTPAILITGGAKRLGWELARKSLAMGYAVVLQYRTDRDEALAWLETNRSFRDRVSFIRARLDRSPERLVNRALKLAPHLAGLVNNAAEFTEGDLTDPAHFRSILAANVMAPLELTCRFSRSVKTGWIINITDAHIRGMNRTFQNYRVSKFILEHLTRQLAFTYAPTIRVNAIAPGAMLPARGRGRREFGRLKNSIPLRRTGDMKSLPRAYEYLVASEYVTGQVLYVDGGWHLVG